MESKICSLLLGMALPWIRLVAQSFTQPLPIPDTLSGPVLNLTMDVTSHTFVDTFSTTTFSFNQTGYLGKTLIWNKGDNITLNVTNNLPETTTLHWHGAHVPAYADGGPHDSIAPGATWSPSFQVMDHAATLWYHPHVHMSTMAQVIMGLAGIIIVRDPADPNRSQLPHRYGIDDIPLVVQDRTFLGGTYEFDTCCAVGKILMANGVINPTLTLPAQKVRLRMLDGCSERSLGLAFEDGTPFHLIATDNGYVEAPILLDSIVMGPGERTEWIVDLTGRQGDTLYLVNIPSLLDPSFAGSGNTWPPCYLPATPEDSLPKRKLLQIVVGPPDGNPASAIPATLTTYDIPDTTLALTRTKHMRDVHTALVATTCGDSVTHGIHCPGPGAPFFLIDSTGYSMECIDDTIQLGAIEKWVLINPSVASHPFHIHDVHFFVVDYRHGNRPLPIWNTGPKDVINLATGDTVTIAMRFEDFGTAIEPMHSYMYHCHMLEHEDGGMMHQFVVADTVTVAAVQPKSPSRWSIFPNPTDGALNLEGHCSERSVLEIMDLRGVVRYSMELLPFEGTMALPSVSLPSGVWLVRWVRLRGSSVQKVFVR